MKTFSKKQSYLLIIVVSFFFLPGSFAQDKNNDGCCTTSHSKMLHSSTDKIENKDSVNTSELTAVEVDSKLIAWNELCPVRGETIDPEAKKVSYNDKIYGFCCNGCDTKFMKDPEKYSRNLSDDGKTFLGSK